MTAVASWIESRRDATLLLALRTPPPKGNLRFVDLVTNVVARLKTRSGADRAVDVDYLAAESTDQVMVVVVYAVLVSRGRSDRLNAPYETFFNQDVEGVVDGLSRDSSYVELRLFDDVIGA